MKKRDRIRELVDDGDYGRVLEEMAGRRSRVFGRTISATPAVIVTAQPPSRRRQRSDASRPRKTPAARNADVLRAIERYFVENIRPPSVRDVMRAAGLESTGTTMLTIHALVASGHLADLGASGQSRRFVPAWAKEVLKDAFERRRENDGDRAA